MRENCASVCKCQVGFAADDCSELVCQGQPMCSDHGKEKYQFIKDSLCLRRLHVIFSVIV